MQVIETYRPGNPLVMERSTVQSCPAAPEKPINKGFLDTGRTPSRQLPAERNANTTVQLVRNPWTLFTRCSAHSSRGGVESRHAASPNRIDHAVPRAHERGLGRSVLGSPPKYKAAGVAPGPRETHSRNAAAPAPQANSAPLCQVAGRRTASVARSPLLRLYLPHIEIIAFRQSSKPRLEI
jgi:hypothetical protein